MDETPSPRKQKGKRARRGGILVAERGRPCFVYGGGKVFLVKKTSANGSQTAVGKGGGFKGEKTEVTCRWSDKPSWTTGIRRGAGRGN